LVFVTVFSRCGAEGRNGKGIERRERVGEWSGGGERDGTEEEGETEWLMKE